MSKHRTIVVTLLCVAAAVMSANAIDLTAGQVTTTSCDSIAVPITATGFTSVAGLELHFSYDDAAMTYASVASDVLIGATINGGSGGVHIIWEDFMNPLTVPDDGEIATLHFISLSGSSPVAFLGTCELVDELGDPLSLTTHDGSATCLAGCVGPAICLDYVDGLTTGGAIDVGAAITFYLRVAGDADDHAGITNGFRIHSPDGATWTTTVGDTTGTLGKTQFDGGFFISPFSVTGSGADTIGFAGFRFFSTGVPAYFDDVAFTIQIGPVDGVHAGKHICLDSAYYPPSGVWKWAGPDLFPNWDGPHCYTIGGPLPEEITSVVPNEAMQGDNLTVAITGQNTMFGQASGTTIAHLIQVSDTISSASVTVNSPTSLDADFQIPIAAGTGLYDVTVTEYDDMGGTIPVHSVTLADGFTINPKPCDITVTAPNGGEVWTVGNTHAITWISDCDCLVRIEVSYNGGVNWWPIATDVPNTGSYNWIVADDNTSVNALVRVCCVDGEPCDVSDAPFVIEGGPVPITLTIPDMVADNCDSACIPITVESFTDVAGVELHLNYDLACLTCDSIDVGHLIGATVNCGNGEVHIIWEDFMNPLTLADGETLVSVCFSGLSQTPCPVGFEPSCELVDELGDPLTVEYYDGSLACSDSCVTTVITPNGGEVWTVGNTHAITWISDCDCLVKIEVSYNNGTDWFLIATDVPNSGSYNWMVTDNPSTNCLIRVCCVDGEPCDVSDAPFVIEGGSVPITLTIPDMVADNCDSACIPITVESFTDVAGVELHLNYDLACLTCDSIDVGHLIGATVNCGNGEVHIIWEDFMNPLTLADGETLAQICFTGLSQTPCPIGFEPSCELVDELGDPFDSVEYVDGSLMCEPPPDTCPFIFTPTSESGVFRGQATIWGVPADESDCIGAFDEDGNCAGAAPILVNEGIGYIVLPIYGDDVLTPDVDEGMNAGENFTLKLFDASENQILEYCGEFDCWQNTNGTPLPGECGDVTNVYDFQDEFFDVVNLNAGWNLISFDVILEPDDPATVFASLGSCLIYVTDFDGGSHYYDPNGPSFLNTLHHIRPGYGFWVKVCDDIVLAVDGVCTYPCNFGVDLDNGWNLIAYWPQPTVTPEVAFADLIGAGVLVYVTGFDGGSQYFDPNGPPFLNTLTEIRNGFGYWVKVNTPWPHFQYEECGVAGVAGRNSHSDQTLYDKSLGVGGPFTFRATDLSSSLTGAVELDGESAGDGDIIAAFDASGNCAGVAAVFMHRGVSYFVLPIYGDDQTTPSIDEGLTPGETYRLKLFDASEGVIVEHGTTFSDWRNTNGAPLSDDPSDRTTVFSFASNGRTGELVPTDFTLSQNYPNPFNPTTTIRFGLPGAAQVELAIYNIVGQKVKLLVRGYYQAGDHEVEWQGTDDEGRPVASGVYFYRLTSEGVNETRKMLLLK